MVTSLVISGLMTMLWLWFAAASRTSLLPADALTTVLAVPFWTVVFVGVLLVVVLPELEPPAILYHGTGKKYGPSIDRQGLLPKSRLYVHLSADKDTAVKVGRRHGAPVVYTVQAGKMSADGYLFYRSVNGVWLTKEVPTEYLAKQ